MLSVEIKKLATKEGVKTKVKTHRTTIHVTFLSAPSDELVEKIRAMSTLKAHGDLIDDSRSYTGTAIYISYFYQIPENVQTQFETIKARHQADLGHHFRKEVLETMKSQGQACLDLLSW